MGERKIGALVAPKKLVPVSQKLSRAERLKTFEKADSPLDKAIRQRLPGVEVVYQNGIRSWAVQGWPSDFQSLVAKLADLPVSVFPDVTFRASA